MRLHPMNSCVMLEAMPEGKKGGRRLTKQGQQDCDRIAKEIWESKQN